MTWLPHLVITEPAGEPVDIDQLRAQCEVDDAAHDIKLTLYGKAARRNIEARTGAKILTQTVLLQCSRFDDLARIPMGPLQSVSQIAYLDSDGTEQVLDPSVYAVVLTGMSPRIRLQPGQSWPATYCAEDAIRVTAVAGFGDAPGDVPDELILAILLLVADWFRDREDSAAMERWSIPNGVRRLIHPFRTFI